MLAERVTPRWQFMPEMTVEEEEALTKSMSSFGFDPAHPVAVDEDGRILDGHHRAKVAAKLGIQYPTVEVLGLTDEEKWDYVYRANVARRHLTASARMEYVVDYVRRHPEESNRAIAAVSGVSDHTVAKARNLVGEPSPEVRKMRAIDSGTITSVQVGHPDDEAVDPGADVRNARGLVRFSLQFDYLLPRGERTRGDGTGSASPKPLTWVMEDQYLTHVSPRDLIAQRAMLVEAFNLAQSELNRRPLESIARR